jgi:uncharacterized protein YggE
VLLLAGLPLAAPAQSPRGKGDDGSRQTLTVTGTGTVKAIADTARISFLVKAQGNTAALAHDALKTKVRKFREELTGLKIAGLEVQAGPVEVQEGASSTPNFGVLDGTQPPPMKVVHVGRTFRVTLRRDPKATSVVPLLEQADRVLLAAAKGGASFPGSHPGEDNPLGRAVFGSSREGEPQRRALDLAVKDALARAKHLAGPARGKTLRVTAIRDGTDGFTGSPFRYDAVTGECEIVVVVQLTCTVAAEE